MQWRMVSVSHKLVRAGAPKCIRHNQLDEAKNSGRTCAIDIALICEREAEKACVMSVFCIAGCTMGGPNWYRN